MNEHLRITAQYIKEHFTVEERVFRHETTLTLTADTIGTVCLALRDQFEFDMLADLTAVDYWPQESPRYHLVYQLHSLSNKSYLCLRVPISGQNPVVPSIEGIYPNANWHEREVWDMFGIKFDGNSDLRRILLPFEWEGHPLRKDYPLGYEEVQFTFNFDEIDLRKPYADE